MKKYLKTILLFIAFNGWTSENVVNFRCAQSASSSWNSQWYGSSTATINWNVTD